MWTQHWPLSELRDVDRTARKIIVENGRKHPASLTSLLNLTRKKGGRGLRSVEQEYKLTKIKSLLKLHQNSDHTMEAVREFEEHAMASGHWSLVREAAKYAEELNLTLPLDALNPAYYKGRKEGDCGKSWESVEEISRAAVLGDR